MKFGIEIENSGSDFWAKEVNFLGLGGKITLGLVVFAEFGASILLILGLLTRPALLILIFTLGYAFFITHQGEVFKLDDKGKIADVQSSLQYIIVYTALLLSGPGKFSLDKLIFKS